MVDTAKLYEKEKINIVCGTCGSEDVKKDAFAVWNKEEQIWEVCSVFDKGSVCEVCGGETSLEEIPIT